MKKVKINYKQVRNATKEFKVLGTTLTVKKDIPYTDKVKCATELAMLTMVADEKQRVVYKSASAPALFTWSIMKWYTNADVEKITIPEIQRLHDAVYADEDAVTMLCYVSDSTMIMTEIYGNICEYLEKVYVSSMAPNPLEKLFDNERADEMISEASILNEHLLGMLTDIKTGDSFKKESNIKDFVQMSGVSFAKKNN